jgi:hypothetical protein
MEGFIESFIYLLITIVILVLSMKKKKQVNLPGSEDSDRPGDPFSDLFRDEPEEEEDESVYRPAKVPSGDIKEEYTHWMTEEPLQEDQAGGYEETNPWMTESEAAKMVIDSDAVLREASENNPIAEMEGQIDDAYHISIAVDSQYKFDLKKAVIYSEILERRVF